MICESPALEITKNLVRQGLNVLAIEPNIDSLKNLEKENFNLVSIEESMSADIKLILVKHTKFNEIDFSNEKYS